MKPSIPRLPGVTAEGSVVHEDVVEGKGGLGLGPMSMPSVQAAGDSVALVIFSTHEELLKCLRTSYVLVPVPGTVLEDLTRSKLGLTVMFLATEEHGSRASPELERDWRGKLQPQNDLQGEMEERRGRWRGRGREGEAEKGEDEEGQGEGRRGRERGGGEGAGPGEEGETGQATET